LSRTHTHDLTDGSTRRFDSNRGRKRDQSSATCGNSCSIFLRAAVDLFAIRARYRSRRYRILRIDGNTAFAGSTLSRNCGPFPPDYAEMYVCTHTRNVRKPTCMYSDSIGELDRMGLAPNACVRAYHTREWHGTVRDLCRRRRRRRSRFLLAWTRAKIPPFSARTPVWHCHARWDASCFALYSFHFTFPYVHIPANSKSWK